MGINSLCQRLWDLCKTNFLCCFQAYNGHCEALKTLAETLVNLDVRDHKGRTALYLATERGSTECVEVLTSHGASALVKEKKKKWTPLHAAGESRTFPFFAVLVQTSFWAPESLGKWWFKKVGGEGRSSVRSFLTLPLTFLTAAYGNTDSLHLLIDSGERVDITDVIDIHGQWVSIGFCPNPSVFGVDVLLFLILGRTDSSVCFLRIPSCCISNDK